MIGAMSPILITSIDAPSTRAVPGPIIGYGSNIWQSSRVMDILREIGVSHSIPLYSYTTSSSSAIRLVPKAFAQYWRVPGESTTLPTVRSRGSIQSSSCVVFTLECDESSFYRAEAAGSSPVAPSALRRLIVRSR